MGSSVGNIKRADQILGPDGSLLGAADLPPKNLKRWVARRKADIVAAVEGGLLAEAEACARYNISREEFSAWRSAYESDGVAGLRARAGRGPRRLTRESETDMRARLFDTAHALTP
jgi:hypothetical protein